MSAKWFNVTNKTEDSADVSIFDEIGGFGVSAKEFCKEISALAGKHINLRINSPGGSIVEGQAIISALSRHGAGFTAWVEGLAASMASVIACAADKCYMADGAMMMIHRASTFSFGDAESLRKDANILEKFEKGIVNVYVKKTGRDEAEINAMLAEETWMDPLEAVALGFADGITGSTPAMACITPETMRAKFDTFKANMSKDQEPIENAPDAKAEDANDLKVCVEVEVDTGPAPEMPEDPEDPEQEQAITITEPVAFISADVVAVRAENASLRSQIEALNAKHASALLEIEAAHKSHIEAKDSLIESLEKARGLTAAAVVPAVKITADGSQAVLTKAQFDALTPAEKAAHFKRGGKLTE